MAYAMQTAHVNVSLEVQADYVRRTAMRSQTASIALDALQTMKRTVAVDCNAMETQVHWTVLIVETI